MQHSRHRLPSQAPRSSSSSSPRLDARVRIAACEALESRAYRTATYSIGDFDRDGLPDLRVRGSSSKEHVVITEDPVNGTTTLWLDQDNNNVQNSKDVIRSLGSFSTIDVDLSSGDDTLEYYAVSSFDATHRSLHLDTNSGNDKLIVDASGDDRGAFNSSVVFDIDLDAGNDTASIKMGAIDNSVLGLNIDGAAGNDTINVSILSDSIITSAVDIDVNLGSGKNKLDVLALATISGGSNFFLDVQGGSGSSDYDQVKTAFTNSVNQARLFVTANLQGGNDSFTNSFDLQGFDVGALGLVRYAINGGDGNDVIALTRDNTIGPAEISEGGLLDIKLTGGNGNDTVKLDLGGNEDSQRGIFLAGSLNVNLDGQAGNDTVSSDLSFSHDPGSFGVLNFSMYGGAGNDTMLFNLLDFFPLDPEEEEEEEEEPGEEEELPEPSQIGFYYGGTGYALVDAGAGTDKTILSGTVLANVKVRSTEKLTVIPFTDVFSS